MVRNAFLMKLKPGYGAEYRKRHDEIWPELSQLLLKSGIVEYSIYLDEQTLTLFAVQTLNPNNSVDFLHACQIMQQWWDHMADIMETHHDNSPVTQPLNEVFHLKKSL